MGEVRTGRNPIDLLSWQSNHVSRGANVSEYYYRLDLRLPGSVGNGAWLARSARSRKYYIGIL